LSNSRSADNTEEKNMQLRSTLLAVGLLALPVAASAQPVTGLYLGAGAGYNLPENDPVANGGVTRPHGGFVGLGSVGYGLGHGFRLELEGNYREGDLHESNAIGSFSGKLQTYGAMGNVLFDMDVGLPWLYPYIGGGVGYAWSHFSNDAAGRVAAGGQTQGNVALQAIAGLSFPVPGVPGLTISSEYRFFDIPGSETFTCCVVSAFPVNNIALAGGRVEHQASHSFLLGVRYAFGQVPPAVPAATPAPAPAAAVAPARSYLVFFDWDKATLTDRARQIIKEAADNSTHVQYTRIEVNGYTDTSGTPQYNMGLSIRRATAVKAELVKDGVPTGAITTQGFGETHLLVPTGQGVREPQNRRVEIVIR
jgi:outer membrane protein OmpA-like peptidoglycan-associated protein